MPIPKLIEPSLVGERVEYWDSSVRELFTKWYNTLDENNVPAQYILRPLMDKDDTEFWSIALPTLRTALEGIAYDKTNSADIVIHRSVTEWEALYAMKLSADRFLGSIDLSKLVSI